LRLATARRSAVRAAARRVARRSDSPERRAGRADTIELIRREGADGLWRIDAPKLFATRATATSGCSFRDADGWSSAVEAIRDREDSTSSRRISRGRCSSSSASTRRSCAAASCRIRRRDDAGRGHLVNLERPDEFNGSCESSSRVSDLPQSSTSSGSSASWARTTSSLGDVRGPNAHARGHIPARAARARLAAADERPRVLEPLAPEVGLRLRRHGVTGDERLVLYDRGDGVGAMPRRRWRSSPGIRASPCCSAACRVARRLGGRPGRAADRKTSVRARFDAVPTREELAAARRPTLTLLDVRTTEEYAGKRGYPCDPRQGTSRRAHVHVEDCSSHGRAAAGEQIRARVGDARRSSRTATPARARRSRRWRCAGGLPRPQLRRLVARVVTPRLAYGKS
jgi:rhodanese-related sulfurtransferase